MTELDDKIPLLVIAGPTASGKTRLAVELAKIFDGEVVSADSMQVYRYMDIATAKPTQSEMEGVPHHLLDFLEPGGSVFSVAEYAKLAHDAIGAVSSRGHLPILTGGTGLYINAVVDNLDFAEIQSDSSVRCELEKLAEEQGGEALLAQLADVDPVLAASLHPNNRGRIIRALEVYRLTGVPMSEHQRRSRLAAPRYRLCMLGLTFADRGMLYSRIDKRVDLMIENDLVEEARMVRNLYGGTARQAIGYKELEPYLDGTQSLDFCICALKQATRRYAKRQLTWFRRDPRVQWLEVDSYPDTDALLEAAKKAIHNNGIL